MGKSAIEWTEAVWNPLEGCRRVSPGCENCYAERYAGRFMSSGGIRDLDALFRGRRWTGEVVLKQERLTEPLRRRKPTTYFVCSRSDLFYESVPDEWIDQIFAVMALCPQHRFLVLTKRAKRMREYIQVLAEGRVDDVYDIATDLAHERMAETAWLQENADRLIDHWPLDNIWAGVSAEDQQRADERIAELLQTPSAHRFVSLEPLLGAVDIKPYLCICRQCMAGNRNCPGLQWVIAGGESGKGARPSHSEWVRAIHDQCAGANVPFFFKQWGAYLPYNQATLEQRRIPCRSTMRPAGNGDPCVPGHWLYLGKKGAGRLLDGREHLDIPWQPESAEARRR